MDRVTRSFPPLVFMVFAGCHDQSTAPRVNQQIAQPSFSTSASFSCATTPTFTVSDEPSLRAALAAASPGAVIALRGRIGLAADLVIRTPNVTLTCAAPGAGLFAVSTAVDNLVLVDVGGSGVAVEGLALDASGTAQGPLFAIVGFAYVAADLFGPGLPVPNLRFAHNTVTCGGGCAFFAGTPGAVISDNTFSAAAAFTGVHVQLGIDFVDSVRVQGNTMVATAPTGFIRFGAIRVFGGRGLVVTDNVVTGPWSNSLSVTFLTKSEVTGNRFAGAAANGILLGRPNGPPIIALQDNLFSSNIATGAGNAGVFANQACNNVFVGNNLQGNVGNVGAVFAATTGANTLVGNGTIVIDNGAFDCDGDGVNDPNIITGAGAVMHGVILGQVVSDAVTTTNGLTLK
ncbi:MAG TPA: right-handed parallel beta-helix repeat-containing protein [Gemmatimonadales bacterium]|nr:right-handed parallel beta-helix repeat-containing protein [Gemmatimonadales bacterium]